MRIWQAIYSLATCWTSVAQCQLTGCPWCLMCAARKTWTEHRRTATCPSILIRIGSILSHFIPPHQTIIPSPPAPPHPIPDCLKLFASHPLTIGHYGERHQRASLSLSSLPRRAEGTRPFDVGFVSLTQAKPPHLVCRLWWTIYLLTAIPFPRYGPHERPSAE